MGSSERKLDWDAVLSELTSQGVELPPTAVPFLFGNTPEMAESLGRLVQSGTKTATAGLAAAWEEYVGALPVEGAVLVVVNWRGEAFAVIRNTTVTVEAFDDVGADFAAAEGEGDRTLQSWREIHWSFFAEECRKLGLEPDGQMRVVCQRFELLWPTPKAARV